MSPDEHSLLDAVVAEPADDTVRLVYADWLEEHAQSDRAEFIRTQIEAERHHPDSARRADLDARAGQLLAANWMDWWAPVCAAVGLPIPERKRASRLGRFAQTIRITIPEGRPYRCTRSFVNGTPGVDWGADPPRPQGFDRAAFRRGFPDALNLLMSSDEPPRLLTRWPAAAPLDRLWAYVESWIDGPFLRGVRALMLDWCPEGILPQVLDSCHLARLEDLSLRVLKAWSVWFYTELDHLVQHPRARQLRRLNLPLGYTQTAESIAAAGDLCGLTALSVDLQSDWMGPTVVAAASERLALLARSPHLAGLTDLTVTGIIDPASCRAISNGPTWRRLRKLTLAADLEAAGIEGLLADATLPALEELRLNAVRLSARAIDQLVRSPLMKQLRHVWVGHWSAGTVPADELRRLPDAFDPDRIETLVLDLGTTDLVLVDGLRQTYGDRLRLAKT
ncbi:MAG: hypothetical protein JWO38_2663 [Gemmataceae bacterium]|nr:hypothetical protein [Gemmataceae bacterium]